MRVILSLIFLLLAVSRVEALDGGGIRRILSQKCFRCHGPDSAEREADLRLDTREGAFAPRDGRPAIVVGKPEASEMIRRVTTADTDLKMPPTDSTLSLSDDEIDQLRKWIAAGADWADHWAFEPIVRPGLPETKDLGWCRTAVDHFVLEGIERAGLGPSPEADPARLVRRLSLDLTGLPPRAEDIAELTASPTARRYLAIVDSLLASPHFGERWGQHWLDLARYADSDGYEMDYPRPNAWRWRDWVIGSINNDMPLDQFAVEQLAGDLLPRASLRQQLATGFHRNSLTNTENGIDKEEFRVEAIVDRVNTTSTVWLGLTAGCAECHSHKYDPIKHQDYYRLFAFFNNTVDEFDQRVDPQQTHRVDESGDKTSASKTPEATLHVFRRRDQPRKTHVHMRGDFQKHGAEVAPGTPAVLHKLNPRHANEREADRLDLAQWIVDPHNPLTPRVEANRIWQHLFGEGLVRTPEDFGTQGEPPTHPQLLDYLALELRDNGWSRKKLIRQIVRSATYRQSSDRSAELQRRDPDNHLLARQNRFRLEAELVRDQYLAAAGLLSQRIGGPSFRPPLPKALEQIGFRVKWRADSDREQRRRGMYIFYHRNLEYPMLKTFDRPDPNVPCPRRTQSNSPLQSLTQLHGAIFVRAERTLGAMTAREANNDVDAGIKRAYRQCLGRSPAWDELRVLRELFQRLQNIYETDPKAAEAMVADLDCGQATAANAAAWIELVRTVMNLDEFVTRE